MKRGDILALVGGQYGSEGKGVIAAHLADRYQVHVRTGGPNAGHSFSTGGKVFKMRGIPCGWINPDAVLVIGRGALIDPHLLIREATELEKEDDTIYERLLIDRKAGVITDDHRVLEGGVYGILHERIGSTGEGVGAARLDRIRRQRGHFTFAEEALAGTILEDCLVEDTPGMLLSYNERGADILLEGTQGSGLSLIHGPWPYVTSHDTNAAQLAADAGISPRLVNRIMMVVRTHPIRVAGNSGPLHNELTWEQVSQQVGKPVTERTTVTNLTRRVGEWDEELFIKSTTLNAPTSVALTFLDYLYPEDEGKTKWEELSRGGQSFVRYVERTAGVRVPIIGTGGPGWRVVDRGWKP